MIMVIAPSNDSGALEGIQIPTSPSQKMCAFVFWITPSLSKNITKNHFTQNR